LSPPPARPGASLGEGDVLVRCMREPDPSAPSRELVASILDSDLPVLVDLASQHGLLPLLALLLRDVEVPDDVAANLRGSRFGQLIRHQVVMEELALVRAALDAASVPWVVVKGPVLSEVCYPRADMRSYGDLDLLVPPGAFGAAIDALCAGGATLVDRNWELALRQMRGELTLTLPRGTVVDLHWHVLNEPEVRRWVRLDPDTLVSRRRPVQLGPAEAWTLDADDTILHLAVHALLGGMRRLVWLTDLLMAHRAFAPDPGELRDRARTAGLELGLAAVAQRSSRILATDELAALAHPRRGAPWLAFLRAVDRLRPPQSHSTGVLSLAHIASSTRATTAASAASLARWAGVETAAVARDRDHPLRRRTAVRSPAAPNPLHRESADPAARRRYLDAVAGYRTR
jgi:hypothetical protein